jgi:hypothetical protein
MMLLDILFTLFLTHVGSLTNVENNQRRFAPTPAHIERNYLPTSPEYALLLEERLIPVSGNRLPFGSPSSTNPAQ